MIAVGEWWPRTTTNCNQEVAGSSPGRSASRNNSGQVVHTHVPLFTKQYKLVPAIGWEGNRRSGVALAMSHSGTGSMAWDREMSLSSTRSTTASLFFTFHLNGCLLILLCVVDLLFEGAQYSAKELRRMRLRRLAVEQCRGWWNW